MHLFPPMADHGEDDDRLNLMEDNAELRRDSSHDDAMAEPTEMDPLYPPAPPGYYSRGEPTRITNFARLVAVLLAVGLACATIAALIDVSMPVPGGEQGSTQREVADLVLGAMDRSADPCEDFYEYACGSWIRANSIPKDRSIYQKSFSGTYDRIQDEIKSLLDGDLHRHSTKEGMFYSACLDQAALGGLKAPPLFRFRDIIGDIENSRSFARALGVLHANLSAGMFEVDVGIDESNPSQYALYLGQGGLGLPHRDDYSSTSEKAQSMRAAYLTEIEAMLNAAGRARILPRFGTSTLAARVLDFEKSLATASLPPAALRDPFKVFNKRELHQLPAGMAIEQYLSAAGIDVARLGGEKPSVVIDSPDFFDAIGTMMERVEHDVGAARAARAYLVFHLVRRLASLGALGENLYHAHFAFRQHVYGVQKLEARWRMCQQMTTKFLGDAVGAAYVKKYFPEERQKVALQMAHDIVDAFGEGLDHQTWMDLGTRNAAKEKLRAIRLKIGFSQNLDRYEGVRISQSSYSGNVQAATEHKWAKKIGRLGQPIDHTHWLMDAHEVNAYYSPPANEVVIPAGILQQPFFSDRYSAAQNLGGIGAILGHEASHGFDDAGRKYDSTGRLHKWWSESAAVEYKKRAQCYVDLYDSFKPRELDIHVLGNLTLGENLADINGLHVAYRAFQKVSGSASAAGNSSRADAIHVGGEPAEMPPNKLLARELTNTQLFFVSFAQNYCMLAHKQSLEVWMKTDPHSPGRFRVQGSLSQNVAFSEAFQCKPGARYSPEKRCSLWM